MSRAILFSFATTLAVLAMLLQCQTRGLRLNEAP
jgi:hypothetical protein